VISKQEAICQLAGLDLFLCSEVVKGESLSGEYRIGTGKEAQHTLLARYAKRDVNLHSMNLYDFFDHWYNSPSDRMKKNFKTKIPLFSGAQLNLAIQRQQHMPDLFCFFTVPGMVVLF
jgi:hypothetical protein